MKISTNEKIFKRFEKKRKVETREPIRGQKWLPVRSFFVLIPKEIKPISHLSRIPVRKIRISCLED